MENVYDLIYPISEAGFPLGTAMKKIARAADEAEGTEFAERMNGFCERLDQLRDDLSVFRNELEGR